MTTYHAIRRAQERAELSQKDSLRLIHKAIERGKSAEMFDSLEREYLKRKEAKNGNFALAYNEYCFIICNSEDTCITVYPLPAWFGKKKSNYIGKQRIRNVRKYSHNYIKPWCVDDYNDYLAS